MSKIYKGAIELIGNTPLVEVTSIERKGQLKAHLLVKLEYFNPAGSVKDRVGKVMTEDAERTNRLKPGSIIIEPTSGSTGIGLVVVSAVKGYRAILTMPDTAGVERRNILKAYGAEIVLTPDEKGINDTIEKAGEPAKEIPDSFVPGQSDNPVNPRAHVGNTGPETWQDTDGQIDIFVASVGTGGALTGAGAYLKEKNPRIKVIAMEPSTSTVLSGGSAGPHKIQGIGAGFIPKVLDTRVYDEIITADNKVPFAIAKMLARIERLFTGISSGAIPYTGIEIARWLENEGKTIVALPPDSGDWHYSTALFVE